MARLSPNIWLGILLKFQVDDDQNVVIFDFCHTNLCVSGLTWRREWFFGTDFLFLMRSWLYFSLLCFIKICSVALGKLTIFQSHYLDWFQLFMRLIHWKLNYWETPSCPYFNFANFCGLSSLNKGKNPFASLSTNQ